MRLFYCLKIYWSAVMKVNGPLSGNSDLWTVPPMDDFVLTGKLSDTEEITNIDAEPMIVTLRIIENTASVEATVTVTTAWGNTRSRKIPPRDSIQGFFNQVHLTGLDGVSDSDLVGYV